MTRSQPAADPAKPPVEFTLNGAVPGVFANYYWKNVSFVIWFAPTTVEAVEVFSNLNASARERHPQGISMVHVMVPGHVRLPSPEAREAYARMSKRDLDWVVASAVVIPGDGFWSSAIRGMITALAVLGPRDLKLHIHASANEIPGWLPVVHLERTGVNIAPSELARVLLELERLQAAA